MSDSCSGAEECAVNKKNEQKDVSTELNTSVSSESQKDDADSFEERSSSEDWTIIEKKESTSNSISDFNIEKELEGPNETVVCEEACDTKESIKVEIEHVEQGEEAGEKELESDDVSIISDESEIDQIPYEEGRVERIEWQVNRRNSVEEIVARIDDSNDANISVHALLICSVVALILGVLIAGHIVDFHNEKASYAMIPEMEAKIKKLNGIEEKLRELKEVKVAIEQIKISMPEMQLLQKKFDDNIRYDNGKIVDNPRGDIKKYVGKPDNWIWNDLANNFAHNKLEILKATYQNFCSNVNQLNSSVWFFENCKTPKILSDISLFKNNLKEAFDKTQQRKNPDKLMFVNIEKKINAISDSLLSDFSIMFSRFSLKIDEKFSKFSKKLQKRLCDLSNHGESDDEFLNIVVNTEYILNHCKDKDNGSFERYSKFNSTLKEKRKVESSETPKIVATEKLLFEHQNENNDKNSREIPAYEKDNDEDLTINESVNRRGEVKYDNNWKNDDHYSKNKYSQNNDKYNNKVDANNRRKNSEMSNDSNNSSKNYKKNSYKSKYEKKQNGTEDKQESSTEKNIQGPERDYKTNEYRMWTDIVYDENLNLNMYRVDHERNNFERRKDYESDSKFYEPNNIYHPEFDQTFEKYLKNDYYYKQENKKDRVLDKNYKNYKNSKDNIDSKYFENVDEEGDERSEKNNNKKRYKQYETEFPKQENFKESKYTKYQSGPLTTKGTNQISGDWQMQRGESREKLRNPDWYFVRADSRRKNRFQPASFPRPKLEREEEENKKNKYPQRPPRYYVDDGYVLYDHTPQEPNEEKIRRHWRRY
ncbi:hypothetical protein TKK_0000936 [Trichogramma kaykai]